MNSEITYEVGEQVIFHPSYGPDIIVTVGRKTPTGRMTLSNGMKLDKRGYEMGGSGYSRAYISKGTPEKIAAVKLMHRRITTLRQIDQVRWQDLPIENLERILEISREGMG